jgi:hypothetical protein
LAGIDRGYVAPAYSITGLQPSNAMLTGIHPGGDRSH